jgi:predicted nucleic acid-binding protein
MILDSNVIIYSALPEHKILRDFILEHLPLVSEISKVEVLGYRDLTKKRTAYFESFFAASTMIPITSEIIECAINLRQKRKMSLGDSLIATTAIVNDLALVTYNTKDFKWIDSLTLIDPFRLQ